MPKGRYVVILVNTIPMLSRRLLTWKIQITVISSRYERGSTSSLGLDWVEDKSAVSQSFLDDEVGSLTSQDVVYVTVGLD